MILWQFDGIKTTYGGNIVGNTMSGLMSNFAGIEWLLVCDKSREHNHDSRGEQGRI